MAHDRILGYFLEEASEHLNTIEQGLRKLPETVKQPTMIRELFRAAHSIKGSAAMLGLLDVQQVSNQFEANFKLLKEQPQIIVDHQLQSLFLESFGFLKAGIEDVRQSSDPYRQDPASPDPIGDPVFEELKSYLQHLLFTVNPTDLTLTTGLNADGVRAAASLTDHLHPRDPAIDQVFGEYVTRKLNEIIGLCLQPDRPENRSHMQRICQKLGNLGENFEFLEWTNLFVACRLAIANPANLLPQLGESISIAVKQAQMLVLADQHQSIEITADLHTLINHNRPNQDRERIEAASTWKLDQSSIPSPQPQPQNFSSIHNIHNIHNLEIGNTLTDEIALPAGELDPDALELNEFMNLLNDDMPTEGTWMQDHDFLDPELPSSRVENSANDKFYQQIFEPVSPPITVDPIANIAAAIEQEAVIGYDEETFYTPDLAEIDGVEVANFWSDTQLASAQSLSLDLDLLDPLDLRLQPDLTSALDLVDIPAPDFGLDFPMSELFTTVPAPPEDLAELGLSEPISSEMITSIEPSFAVDIDARHQNYSVAQITNGIDSSVSDVLFLEELNSSKSPEITLAEVAQITDGIGSSVSDVLFLEELNSSKSPRIILAEVDDFAELGLDSSIDSEPINTSLIDGNLADLNLNPLDSNKSEINAAIDNLLIDLTFDDPIGNGLDIDPIDRDFADLDLNPAHDHDFTDFNLAEFSRTGSPSMTDTQADDLVDISPSNHLDLDMFNSDLDSLDRSESVAESSVSQGFGDFDPNLLDGITPHHEQLEHLNLDELTSSSFEDLSDLDFDLDQLSADASQELTDLGSILDQQSGSNLTEADDLDALFGTVALGVVGAAAIGTSSKFDDLDALVASPEARPEASPTDNLDDLDQLLGYGPWTGNPSDPTPLLTTPTPVVIQPPEHHPDQKSTDRRAKQSRTFEQTMRVSVRHLNNLNNLVGELVVNRNTLEQDQNRMRQFVEKLLSEVQKLNEVGKRMQDLYERSLMENSLVASRQQSKPTTPISLNSDNLANSGTLMEYDPLEMDRFTPIHLLSQKMIELTVRVRESTADIEFVVDGSTEVTRTLRQITGQLQEDLTKSRMVPFAQTADRLQRGVRDNGLKYGKQVELTVEGRDTLIDKVILESLTDPLIHMMNNAIAHGIEAAEHRQALGKPSEGKITIRALHQGNQTIISIADDGAGINTEKVKAKAIEKGIITAQQATTMSKTETYELLFLPSFSTKDEADELSGRGVGMDVVKTSITEIRGTITTESQLGVGTTFTIRLPLALSIAKALIAVNNKCNIAFPMDGIEDTQDISPEQIQTNGEGKQCVFWRDELMPFTPLSDLLGFNRPLARNNFYTTNEDDSDLVSILILRSDVNLIAIQVDKITGDQEIVIKPLQGPASKPLGIAGATVLGDGRIIPIADVMELIALAKGTITRHVSTQWTAQINTPTIELRESMVLIVDDSITVRELLSLTFKRAGYRVEQARDGQEAWDKLRAGLPCDIVFCDIEMPRMDGLEFLSRVQKDVALSKVPVAMLTSRGSDRHRQIAAQLGASGYFIKPYLEEALLDAAKRMIKGEVLQIV